MKKDSFEIVISFMQGVSWGIVVVAALLLFVIFYPFGLLVASLSAVFGASVGMVMVVFFEMAYIKMLQLKESKKQTEILTKIATSLEKDKKLSNN